MATLFESSEDTITEIVEVCGSPFEVANDPAYGHRYALYASHGNRMAWDVENRNFHPPSVSRSTLWTTVSLSAEDQLRQRTAW